MSDRAPLARNYRPMPAQSYADREGRMYDDRHPRSDSRDRYRQRSFSPRRRSPPYDEPPRLSRGPPADWRDPRFEEGEWDFRRDRDFDRARDDFRRGRSRSPPRRRGGPSGYRDLDSEGYQSPPGHQHRSRSPSLTRRSRSPYFGGPPSRDVIMESLPLEMQEDDIATQLKYDLRVEGLESVRIIKDRQTGLSRQFGFLHFFSVLDARAFLELNYPSVLLYNSSNAEMKSEDNHPSKVRISFCRERDDRERGPRPEEEWKCPICSFPNYARRMECRRCQASKNDMAEYEDRTVNQYINTGDSDVSPDGTASQFLLFRGLEPSVTEELLAKGASKLFKTTGSSSPSRTQSGKKGNHKIASTSSDANFGAKEGSLKRVLLVRDRRTGGSWRYGFAEFSATEDSQAALAKFNAQEKFTISSKEVAVSYIHAGVFVPILDHNSHLERFTFSPLSNPSMKLAYWDEDAYVSELVMPEMKDRSGSKGTTKASSSHGRSMAEKEGLVKGAKEGESKTKKRKADSSNAANAKKAVPAHLNFWRNRHAELHGIAPENPKADPDAAGTTKSKNTATGGSPPAQSFADMNRKCCLLCSRQFKTEAEVNKHERLSQLHRDNSKNEDLKKKALAKLAKSEAAESPAYRDRARERRAAFKQPKRPAPDVAQKQTRTDPPPKEEETPAPSKGAALLGKMGWSAGEGLGAQGEGMAAPISTEMYVQGVGLGAQGGKVGDAAAEAVRNTKGGYEGFLEKTRDKAKERFDRLS